MQGCSHAGMAELADAQDLGSCAARRAGSTPATRTTSEQGPLCSDVFLCLGHKRCHLPAPLLLLSKPQPLRWLAVWMPQGAFFALKAGISLYTSPQTCYISLIIDYNFTGSDAVSGGSPVQGRRSLTSTVCAHGVQARSPGGVLTSARRWRDWVTAPVPVRSLPLGEGVFSREDPSLPISLI